MGNDILDAIDSSQASLTGGAGDDTLYGSDGNDLMDGGDGNDFMYGYAGGDTMSGGNGNDHMEGGSGIDSMSGQGGDDVLYDKDPSGSDSDNDYLDGGANGAGGDTLGGAGAGDTHINFEH